LKETLGAIAIVDVMAKGKKKSDFKKPADVTALMNAIGPDQTAEGPLRKCADDMELQMKDKDGKVKGHVGLCAAGDMGAEFWSDGDRKGIMLSDATAVRKMLKVPTPKAAAPKKAGK
jgi:hypothetical protein